MSFPPCPPALRAGRRRPVRRALLGLLVALPLLAASAARADDPPAEGGEGPPLELEGEALLKEVTYLGQDVLEVSYRIHNHTGSPVAIRGDLLAVDRGGWLTPLDPENLDGSLFRERGEIAPGEQPEAKGPWIYNAPVPTACVLLSVQTPTGHLGLSLPAWRDGFETPTPIDVPYPFGVGVVGPLEVVPYADGRRSVVVIGQHQALGEGLPQEVETELLLGSADGVLEPERFAGLDQGGDRSHLWPFLRRMDVPADFDGGILRVTATATIDGHPVRFARDWPVRAVTPVRVDAPVLGAWQLGNGPAQPRLHGHHQNPLYRYAYDMVVVEQGSTYRGPVHRNESYFAWNRSIRAAADGVVVDVCDREPDHPGNRGSVMPCLQNRVVLEHAGGLFTAYLHIRQRSATLTRGDVVKAGQVIARVGNSGLSSEPHLHFMAFRVDPTGRLIAVPVSFTNAWHDAAATQPVEGVPPGGGVVHFVD